MIGELRLLPHASRPVGCNLGFLRYWERRGSSLLHCMSVGGVVVCDLIFNHSCTLGVELKHRHGSGGGRFTGSEL